MKPKEKNQIMEQFASGEIQVLVSTTVVEVGVNVPNATVMMVENAERFGLAQLHQLRGRVGRGEYQSYCIFMQGNEQEETSKRLEILNKSNDGFFIAGEDLKLRGPGDLFGIRQSGQQRNKNSQEFGISTRGFREIMRADLYNFTYEPKKKACQGVIFGNLPNFQNRSILTKKQERRIFSPSRRLL